MRALCFYFQVHQPFRLRTYRFFDIGENHLYYDEYRNRYIIRRVTEKCYIPMNQLLLDLIKQYGEAFKISFSLSGVVIEQFQLYAPEVLESFQKLAATGNVEFLAETYAHSLSSLRSKNEFIRQVKMHSKLIEDLFGQKPTTFRNTELIYSDEIGSWIADLGYKAMLTEGAKHILGWRSPNYLYCNAINPRLKVLLKNFRLSDDIAFRFSQHTWDGFPLTSEKFVDWLNAIPANEPTVNLFMDYETFGEHQWKETGIFEFMKALPGRIFLHSDYRFHTPSEVAQMLQPVSAVHVPDPISWADEERDVTAWLGNDLQRDAFNKMYELEERVVRSNNPDLQRDWLYLQTSDHFYYMCTKWFSDGDVHKYFNPYNSPYEAYINFMNILSDFIIRLDEEEKQVPSVQPEKEEELPLAALEEIAEEVPAKSPAKKSPKATKKKTTVKAKKGLSDDTSANMELLLDYSDSAIRKAIKGLDAFTLELALCGASDKVRERIIANAGIRIANRLKNIEIDEEEYHPRDIERCRRKIFKNLTQPKSKKKK